MSDNVPRLTGGILFGLILEAKKSRTRVRSTYMDKNDGLTEYEIMKSFISVFYENNEYRPRKSTLTKNTSDYKKCDISVGSSLPFNNQSDIDKFNKAVELNEKDTLERMSRFVEEKLSEEKLNWLTSVILETIYHDSSIENSKQFKVSLKEQVLKENIPTLTTVEVELFLLDVMRYIFVNKIDNTLGKPTFEEWYSQNGANTQWKFSNSELGKSLPSLEIIRYSRDTKRVGDVEEPEYFDEVHTDTEEKSNFKTKSAKVVEQQWLSSPEVINQYASNINIEQANNVNNFVNYKPAHKILSPNEYYNLFIIYGEQYEGDSFTIENGRIFEYTNTAVTQKFSQLTLEDIDEIISLPALFLPEYSDSNQDIKTGFFGKLVEIDKRTGYTKLEFHKECEIDLNSVVLRQADLKLEGWELSRTHWAIKRANLMDILESLTNGNETE